MVDDRFSDATDRCPDCGEEGSDAVATRKRELACVNRDCRVRRFSGSKDDGLRADGSGESGSEHEHEVGEVLVKSADGAEWKITNRMIDVDTDEVLYRLREVGGGDFTEICTESQLRRRFNVDDGLRADGSGEPDIEYWVRCPECDHDDVEVAIVDGRRIEFNCRVCDAFAAQSFGGGRDV